MLKRLQAFFAPRHELPHNVHSHLDDDGRRVFCDESVCRPANDSPLLHALYGPHIR